MAANQAIEYAPQCGDLTMGSLIFHNNNVVGNFSYPQTTPPYYDIFIYLMNCPLVEAFTKAPLVVCQNFLREFWCTSIAYDPNPPTDDSEVCPLKELDYAKGIYVSHPSPEAKKAELAKIVFGRNYSSAEQVNSIQQLIAYCLLTGTKVDIGEIIYNDLVTRLTNKSRQRYVSYPRFVSCALVVLLGSDYTQDDKFGSSPTILSNSNFSKDPSKKKNRKGFVYRLRTSTFPVKKPDRLQGELPLMGSLFNGLMMMMDDEESLIIVRYSYVCCLCLDGNDKRKIFLLCWM
ncbi:hypothetical protein Tco_0692090 [Tanacetum coccineum]